MKTSKSVLCALAEGVDPLDAHWAKERQAFALNFRPEEPAMPDPRFEVMETIGKGLDQAYKGAVLAVVEYDGGSLRAEGSRDKAGRILAKLGERLTDVMEAIERAKKTQKRLVAALEAEQRVESRQASRELLAEWTNLHRMDPADVKKFGQLATLLWKTADDDQVDDLVPDPKNPLTWNAKGLEDYRFSMSRQRRNVGYDPAREAAVRALSHLRIFMFEAVVEDLQKYTPAGEPSLDKALKLAKELLAKYPEGF